MIDADDRGAELHRALSFVFVVNFDQHVHAEVMCAAMQARKVAIIESRGDQQDRVGASGPRLHDLVFIDDEILAQQRHGHAWPNPCQERQVAVEIVAIGQHRQRDRAVVDVIARHSHRIGTGGDRSCRWRRALDLREHANGIARPAPQRDRQRPRRPGDRRRKLLARPLSLGGRELDAFGRDDLRQDVRQAHVAPSSA